MDLTYLDIAEKGKNILSGLQKGQDCSGKRQAVVFVSHADEKTALLGSSTAVLSSDSPAGFLLCI